MQSHLLKFRPLQRRPGRGGGRGLGQISRFAALTCEQSVLLGPVERQIEFAQTRRGEFTGLPPLQDRLDQLRAQEGKANETPDVAPGDAVALGQFLERSNAAGGELLKPRAPARDRLDQRRITSRSVVLLRQSRQHQLGFGTAPLEGDCRGQFDSIVTSVLRCGSRDTPPPHWPPPTLDSEKLV